MDIAAVIPMLHSLAGAKRLTAVFLERHCFGKNKSVRGWVATAGSKVIGFTMTSDWANFNLGHIDCTLDFLFVAPNWHGQNIGRRLAACAAQDALQRGCVWFRTSANPANKEAQRLYRNLGFTQRAYRPILYLAEGKALRELAKQK